MYGKTQAKILAIDEITLAVQTNLKGDIAEVVSEAMGSYNSTITESKTNTTSFMEYQVNCLKRSQDCGEYDEKRRAAINAMLVEAEAFSTYQYAAYFKNPADYINHLGREKAQLEAQASRIQGYLGGSSPYLGGLIDPTPLSVENLTDAYKDDEWLKFDYDSESYFDSKDTETTSSSISASGGIHILFFHIGGSYSYNKNTYDYNEKLVQANLRVKGELLRVNIKRPWFKPEVFEIPDLTYVSYFICDAMVVVCSFLSCDQIILSHQV
jgi:hypothetical protein